MSLVFAKEKCSWALLDFLFDTDVERISREVEEAENTDHEESSDWGMYMSMLFFGDSWFVIWGMKTCAIAFAY